MTLAALVSFPVTLTVVRILGKKQVSTMTAWDLVSAITMGSLAANIITNQRVHIGAAVWVVVQWGALTLATDWSTLKSRFIRGAVQSVPLVVVANGQILEQALRKERMDVELLLSELRAAGAFSVRDVEFAILEPTGKLSVLKRTQAQPATAADLHVATPYKGLATALVMDGAVLEENLRRVGLDRAWLEQKLHVQGVGDLSRVFYAELDTDGTLYVDQQRDTAAANWQLH